MSNPLHRIRVAALRLQRYSDRIKDKVWAGDRASLINALSDTAEISEIAHRLWPQLQKQIALGADQSELRARSNPLFWMSLIGSSLRQSVGIPNNQTNNVYERVRPSSTNALRRSAARHWSELMT